MSNPWDVYLDRADVHGPTKRDAVLKREKRAIHRKLPDSLSYQTVTIYEPEYGYNITSPEMIRHAISKEVAVINSDNLDEKTIISLPDDDLTHGSLIYWMDSYWLITERDANTTIYTKAKMIQCNHLLKWVSDDNVICEQWCIIEDGTKYLTGEFEDRNFIVTRGDSRISMTIARNPETVKMNRLHRFIIDDTQSPRPLAYQLTKPLKLGWSYNNQGAYKFVLQEVTTTDNDNLELGIADYYLHFPKTASDDTNNESSVGNSDGSEGTVWI